MRYFTKAKRDILLSEGFIRSEIKGFDERITDTNDIEWWDRPASISMRESRKNWTTSLLSQGWKPVEVYRKLAYWYKSGKLRSEWDFFRAEYTQVDKKPELDQGSFAKALNARQEIKEALKMGRLPNATSLNYEQKRQFNKMLRKQRQKNEKK